MRGIICSLLLFFLLCSCKQSAISLGFSSADSVVLHFKNEQAGVVAKTVQTTDTKAIRRIVGFIDSKTKENLICGHDGKMFFFRKGERIQEVDFKINDVTCNNFTFLLGGDLISTSMSNEAISFLEALEKGLPYY